MLCSVPRRMFDKVKSKARKFKGTELAIWVRPNYKGYSPMYRLGNQVPWSWNYDVVENDPTNQMEKNPPSLLWRSMMCLTVSLNLEITKLIIYNNRSKQAALKRFKRMTFSSLMD